ncbi:MAG: DUF2079 domain-containing protein [Candidatus Bathycorpusculaceae bacterium]
MKIETSNRNLKLNLLKWLKDYKVLHILVIAYITILSIITLVRHYSFETSTWDLGIFSQACYTTLKGKLFYYTAELYANPGGSIFGVHFSPILFGVLPFYALFPTPETLLIIQTIVLAVGAYPTFFITKRTLNSNRLGIIFSIFYLLNPLVYSINIFDFHPDSFFVPLALFSLYFFIKEKWGFYFLFMLLGFLTKEFMPLGFLMFALGELLWERKQIHAWLKRKEQCPKKTLVLILTVIASLSWFLIATLLIRVFNPNPPSGFAEGSPWEILGGNPLNPSSWLKIGGFNFLGAIKFELQSKLFFLITILAPFAFLPVFKLSRFLPVLFWLLLAFLSNYAPYYNLGFHYPALFIPFLILAAMEGFYNLCVRFRLDKSESRKIAKKLLLVGVLSSLTFIFAFSPIVDIKFYMISEHDRKVAEALSWIKTLAPNASILTQYDLFPHISNMMDAYLIPPPFAAFKRDYYYEYANSLFDKNIDYIIIDLNPDARTHAHYMAHLLTFKNVYAKGNYGLYASIDGVLIYKFEYKGNPTRFEPFTIHNRYYDAKITTQTTLFGQYFPPGIYNVTYCMKISPLINERAFTLEVDQNRSIIVARDVLGSEFTEDNTYKTFTPPPVIISDPTEEVQFLITNPSIRTEINIAWLEISLISHDMKQNLER